MSQAGKIKTTGGSPSITTINGDTGSATGSTLTFNAASQAGASMSFSATGSTVSFNDTDINNTVSIGNGSTANGASNCVIVGRFASTASSANTGCVLIGYNATSANLSSSYVTSIGYNSTSFDHGVALGFATISGTYSVSLGASSGSSGFGSSNIFINNVGTVGDSNTLRIGAGTGSGTQQLNKCFIAGIDGVNVGSVAKVVTESGDQLGTATITAGTGITITPTANTITIAASGTTNLTYTNVNSTPYVVLTTDEYISVDASVSAITIQLPNAAISGRAFIIKDRTGSAATRNITVTTVGGAVTIDGATTFVMNANYQSVSVIGNGSSYEVY